MTFGIGSPGFDPFHCPPCDTPPGSYCNMLCIDPLDFTLLVGGVLGLVIIVGWLNGAAPRQL